MSLPHASDVNEAEYYAITYRFNGKHLLHVTRKGKTLFSKFTQKRISKLLLSNDGQRLMTFEKGMLTLYNTKNGEIIMEKIIPDTFTECILSKTDDGKHFYFYPDNSSIYWLFRAKDGAFTERSYERHGSTVIILSNDTKHLAFIDKTGRDYRLILDNRPLGISLHEEEDALRFSRDNTKLVSFNETDLIFYDVSDGREIKRIKLKEEGFGEPSPLMVNHDGRIIKLDMGSDEVGREEDSGEEEEGEGEEGEEGGEIGNIAIDFKNLALVPIDDEDIEIDNYGYSVLYEPGPKRAVRYSKDHYEISIRTVRYRDLPTIFYTDHIYMKKGPFDISLGEISYSYGFDYGKILGALPAIRSLLQMQRQYPEIFPDLVLANIMGDMIDSDNQELVRYLLSVAKSRATITKEELVSEIERRI